MATCFSCGLHGRAEGSRTNNVHKNNPVVEGDICQCARVLNCVLRGPEQFYLGGVSQDQVGAEAGDWRDFAYGLHEYC